MFLLLLSFFTPKLFSLKCETLHIKALVKLLIFFAFNSLKGGVQVAFFALHPTLKLSPFVYAYKLKTKNDFSASILANICSLMPGTLSMGLKNETLHLHILDESLFDAALLHRAEEYVMEAFENGENG
jgi:multicomponent Na+:H+ antiporter subunit E